MTGFEQPGNGAMMCERNPARPIWATSLSLRSACARIRRSPSAGLEIGERGGIRVDDQMRTSDPDIFAVGDAVEVKDFVTGESSLVALAGPANRQGRMAADVIAGRNSQFRGMQGTAIVGLFGAAFAWTGVSEKTLSGSATPLRENLSLSEFARWLLSGREDDPDEGAVPEIRWASPWSASLRRGQCRQAHQRLAMALQMGATVYDLEESELCYAPQFGSAKDPVNFAGMVAGNALSGDMPLIHWDAAGTGFLLDVREPSEIAVDHGPEALNIPVGQLRARLGELPRDREIHVFCRSGQRSYIATRILLQNGFKVKNISGGMLNWAQTGFKAR